MNNTMNFDNFDLDLILGREVEDTRGERLGEVKNLYLDDATGQPSFITVSGPAGRLVAVPAQELSEGTDALRVPFEKDFIEGAPTVFEEHISEEEQDSIYAYYRESPSRNQGLYARDSYDEHREDARLGEDRREDLGREQLREGEDIVLHEERAHVDTVQQEVGRAKLRKYVVTEQQTVTVPVTREELVVEREPIAGGEALRGDHRIGADSGEQVITLHEERPVVSKETVATERVTLGVDQHTEQVTVPVETAREEVTIEQDGRDITREHGFAQDGGGGEGHPPDYDRDGHVGLDDKAKGFLDRDKDGNGVEDARADLHRDYAGDGHGGLGDKLKDIIRNA